MRRVAFNKQIEIPKTYGLHELYRVPKAQHLVVRVVGVIPEEESAVVRLMIGDYILPLNDIDPYETILVPGGQTIAAVCHASSDTRSIQLTGFLEDAGGLCGAANNTWLEDPGKGDPDQGKDMTIDPFETDQSLIDDLINAGVGGGAGGLPSRSLVVFNSNTPLMIDCVKPMGKDTVMLYVSARYTVPSDALRRQPGVVIRAESALFTATETFYGPLIQGGGKSAVCSLIYLLDAPMPLDEPLDIQFTITENDPAQIQLITGAVVFGTNII